MTSSTITFMGLEDRQRVLADILQSVNPRPGLTFIAYVAHPDLRVSGVRAIRTPELFIDHDSCFPHEDLEHLGELLGAIARDLDPRSSWGVPRPDESGDLVTVVCREGAADLSPTETLLHLAWGRSHHAAPSLRGDVYAVTPEGWAGLASDWRGTYPALALAAEVDPDLDLPPGLHGDHARGEQSLMLPHAIELPEARPRECLNCFVHRMLETFGCTGDFQFARHYRDTRAPRAKALEARLAKERATCDCELLTRGWQLVRPRRHGIDHPAGAWVVVDRAGETKQPRPKCQHYGSGSSQPCSLWRRRSR